MNPIVYHIVSGHSWFSGIALLLLAVILEYRFGSTLKKHTLGKWVNLLWPVAVLLMLLASIAAAAWVYAWLGVSLVIWLRSTRRASAEQSATGRARPAERGNPPGDGQPDTSIAKTGWQSHWPALVFTVGLLAAIAVELPFHFQPTLQPLNRQKMTIIGDSVTAGVGGNETSERWPQILQRMYGWQIQDISHMGETAKSATKRLTKFEVDSPLIIVEIGGNDVLGGTSVSDFDRHLDGLLKAVCMKERQVVMFELPLPPLFHGYGYVQRRLAAKHGVKLLPKSTFLSAISAADATLDSIHLTQAGHQRMADAVWEVVKNAVPEAR